MRIEEARGKLDELGLDGIIFTNLINIRYLCGYTGSNGILLVTGKHAVFFTDFRYKSQAPAEVKGAEVVVPDNSELLSAMAERRELDRMETVGFEENISYSHLQKMKAKLPEGLTWEPVEDFMGELRASKEEWEIEKIQVAIACAERALLESLPELRPGIVEREFAAELEYRMRKGGAEKPAFDTIVVSGPRSALVHGIAGDRKIQSGDFVTIDYGARVDGYSSDITRTFIMGEPSKKQREIYELVYNAQAAAIEAARPGIPQKELDAVARDMISEAGYGDYFGHGLGHGLGLLVHDTPRVSRKSDQPLPEKAVITIEPGVYLPDFGGVRIEDDILLEEGGCRVLTSLPRKLDDIIIE